MRSGGKGTSKRQKTLCDEGWLVGIDPTNPQAARNYDYGSILRPGSLRYEWRVMSERIWGSGGYLRGWLKDPLFAHGALGWSGTLIYAVLLRHPGRFRIAEIQHFFGGLFSPAQTAYRVRALREKGILVVDSLGHDLSVDHQEITTSMRAKYSSRRDSITYSVAQERRKFRASFGISDRLEQIRLSYRGLTCIRCTNQSEQIEHFPPLKWSGEDDWFLTFPICEECNGKTSLFIQENGAPRSLTVRKVSLVGGNPLRGLEERIASYRYTFYSCVESGQTERAMKAVAKARATFEAHTGESWALIFRLPSGVDFHLDPKRHGLLLDPSLLTAEKPLIDPGLTRVPIRRNGPNPKRTRDKNFNDSGKS